jgi:hypothetical protein
MCIALPDSRPNHGETDTTFARYATIGPGGAVGGVGIGSPGTPGGKPGDGTGFSTGPPGAWSGAGSGGGTSGGVIGGSGMSILLDMHSKRTGPLSDATCVSGEPRRSRYCVAR